MSIVDAHAPRTDDLDAIAQMAHVKAFQLTTTRKDNAVACAWRAVANDRRYEAGMEPGDTVAALVARARAQLASLATDDPAELHETTENRKTRRSRAKLRRVK